jgi:hypothetical protein
MPSELYDDVATFGRYRADFGAAIAVLFAIIAIYVGASQLMAKPGAQASAQPGAQAKKAGGSHGWALIGAGVVIGAIGVGVATLANRSKNFAAYEGATTLLRL